MNIDFSIDELTLLFVCLDLVKDRKLLDRLSSYDPLLLHQIICKIDDVLST